MNYIDTNNKIQFLDIAGNIVPYIATIKDCIHPTKGQFEFITLETKDKSFRNVCGKCGNVVVEGVEAKTKTPPMGNVS
jgi:hypothetical protein